jgi:hypothetical protein
VSRREHIEELTRRWAERHDRREEQRRAHGDERPVADPERAARAEAEFPFRSVTPAEYVARHGPDMTGYTYDDYRYAVAHLQRWIDEVGRLLRERRGMDR